MNKFLLLLVLIPGLILSQDKPFDFEFDYAQFAYDSTSNYLELYYSFNQESMEPAVNESMELLLEGILQVIIYNPATSDTIVGNQWLVKHAIKDTLLKETQSLVGVIGFVLPEAKLICEVTGYDAHNREHFRKIEENLEIKPFLNGDINISDIQLASKMVQQSENKNSIFYKNTYEVMPIPNLVFGEKQPVLFFYTEIYNLKSPLLKSDNLKFQQLIYNSKGRLVKEKDKYFSRPSDSRVEVGSFTLSNLPTDTYTLFINVIDSSANAGVSTSKKFFVYNPSVVNTDTFLVSTTPSLSSMFGAMSEEELDDLFEKSRYIATSPEIDKYKSLNNVEGKREFTFEFWKKRDYNPSTPANEYFLDYLKRIEISNDRYTAMGKAGWKTDRGRVYLMYGEPTEIERYPNQLETRPYEIWQYTEIEGGVYFVFADLTGFSDYTLVHSTKRGELRDDNWSRRIVVR